MDTAEDAREYDAMDHAAVNAQFVTDLLANAVRDRSPVRCNVLDLGAGTAQIPIELCPPRAARSHHGRRRRRKHARASAAEHRGGRPRPTASSSVLADAKQLPFKPAPRFPSSSATASSTTSPSREQSIAEAIRVTAPGGLLFHRDLVPTRRRSAAQQHRRPPTPATRHAYQRKLFADSLRAALTVEEMRDLVAAFGFARDTVRMTSDRHWTWVAKRHSSRLHWSGVNRDSSRCFEL